MYIYKKDKDRKKSDPWKNSLYFSRRLISHAVIWATGVIFQEASLAHTRQEKENMSHPGEGCWERSYLRRRPRRPRRPRWRQRRVGQSNLATGDGRRYRPLTLCPPFESITHLIIPLRFIIRHTTVQSLCLPRMEIGHHAEYRCCSFFFFPSPSRPPSFVSM